MKGRTAPKRGRSNRTDRILTATIQEAAARVARVLEALGDCDLELATLIAEDLEHDVRGALPREFVCRKCGVGFPWPGDLADHRLVVHAEAR
jgi:hypothetical protein